MDFSFSNLKRKIGQRLSGKFTEDQVEEAFDKLQTDLVQSFKDAESTEKNELRLFQSTKEFDNMKNVSYWIFNNYGIPEDDKCVFEMYLSKGFVLAQKTNHKDQLYEKIKSGVLKRAFKEIISEYIIEYTNGYNAFDEDIFSAESLFKSQSIFEKIDKQLYSDYKHASDYTGGHSQIHSEFVNFKSSKNYSSNENGLSAIRYAEDKKKSYINTDGIKHKAKLIVPFSGLVFDSINEEMIANDAESWNLSKEELLAKVRDSLAAVESNGFITIEAVYNSEYLFSYVLFRKAWYFLSSDNEPIIVDMLNTALNNQPSYYGSGANEKNGRT